MSSNTAQGWFLPNSKWKALTEDYALVNYSASEARDMIDDTNLDSKQPIGHTKGPCECFAGSAWNPYCYLNCYAFNFMQKGECAYTLIYADVDDTNPEHKQMLAKKAWTDELLEEEETCYAAIQQDYTKSFVNERSASDLEYREDREKSEAMDFGKCEFNGRHDLEVEATKFLFKLESAQDRQRFLQIISAKTRVKHKRPIMLLIRMINTEQITVPGSTSGYAIAFNVLEERLTIRPFYSDEHTHPLTSPWTTAVRRDGICFYGTPLEFAHEFIRELPKSGDVDLDIKLLVHGHAIRFLLDHWTGLFRSAISREESKSLENEVHKIHLERIEMIKAFQFPATKRVGGSAQSILRNFLELRGCFHEAEESLRVSALEARDGGKEKVAKNAAKAHGKLLGIIDAFIEDPTKEP
ncbi:MAG: hypothetical protein Q9195_004148 [Heterodermia aff. obscurata]